MRCSNCESPMKDVDGMTVRLNKDNTALTHLCGECISGVLTLKIVLSRQRAQDSFTFSGYLPVASER
jgi:RNase P subunit RPR2